MNQKSIFEDNLRRPEYKSKLRSSTHIIIKNHEENDKERLKNEIVECNSSEVKKSESLFEQCNKLKRENQNLRAKNEKLKTKNEVLRVNNEEYMQKMSWLADQLEELKNRNYAEQVQQQKVLESMKHRLQNKVESSESDLSKMDAKISQLDQKLEKLTTLTKELIKKISKESIYSEQLVRRNDQLNEQIKLLKRQFEELTEEIDEERDCKAQHARKFEHMLDAMKKELIKKKMFFAEHTAKLEKDIIARMDKYSTRIQSVISISMYASNVLKKINTKKLEDEEESYKYTNAFTSAGEGSVLDISKRYRHLQHNMRASAVRASKTLYKGPAKTFFCSQTLNAYEVAKNVLLEESGKCIYMHLIKLQPSDKQFNDKMLKACMRIVDHVATDEVANDAIKRITEELQLKDAEERSEAAKDVPLAPDVTSYYHTLAELTWQAISRPIPMVYEMEEQVYKKDYHDLKDGESNDEGEAIAYIYPVLYSSNQWPRQIAQMGRVELEEKKI